MRADEKREKIRKGMLVRPVVFFSDWLGVVLTEPYEYEPTEEDEDMMSYIPSIMNPKANYWEDVYVVDVMWFSEAGATQEFVDFLEIVSPPQDCYDDPDYIAKRWDFDWTDEDE
tara:strand:+ start:2905 stop:3246 length:342 start_codon:yes stop_codon:yes gene_type:complete